MFCSVTASVTFFSFFYCLGSRIASSLAGFPGTRGAGEGAECEEPAVSKGGNLAY